MNSNHKQGEEKKQVIKNPVNDPNVAKANIENKNKNIKGDVSGENCEVNPVKGISYIPPKDENTL
jgi:hypothetical protein